MAEIVIMIFVLHAVKSACNATIHYLDDWWEYEDEEEEKTEKDILKKYRR